MLQSHFWEANNHSVKKFAAFYGTRRFVVVFARACHLPLSWARRIHSTPSHTEDIFLSTPGFCGCFLISGFPSNILYDFLVSTVRAACPARLTACTISVELKSVVSVSCFVTCILRRILLGWSNQGGWGGLDMWHAWGTGDVLTGFWLGGPKARDHWEDLGVGGRITLRLTLGT
jgi:hypothetical protein